MLRAWYADEAAIRAEIPLNLAPLDHGANGFWEGVETMTDGVIVRVDA